MNRAAAILPDFAADVRPCFYEGQRDAMDGLPIESCRFKSQPKIAAYHFGWHTGWRLAQERAEAPPTPEETARALPQLAKLKALTAGWHDPSPFWSVQYRTDQVAHVWLEKGQSACGAFFWPSHRERQPIRAYHGTALACLACSEWAKRTGAEVRA